MINISNQMSLLTNSDMFSVTELTASINQKDNVPGRIAALKIFNEKGITTTEFALEYQQGVVKLVKTSIRGGDGVRGDDAERTVIKFNTTHLKQTDSLLADDFINIRPFGNQSFEGQVQKAAIEKLEAMKDNNEATIEYQRAGALVGKILDADGTVVLDIFKKFNIKPVIDTLDLANGDTKKQIRAIKKKSKEALKTGYVKSWRALCGPDFFDALNEAGDVKSSFVRFEDGQVLRTDSDSIDFASVTWEEYDAFVGDTRFIASDEAILIPDIKGLCLTRFAPADYVETVGTEGMPHYAKSKLKDMDRGFDLETQSNPISIITVPLAVRRIKLKAQA